MSGLVEQVLKERYGEPLVVSGAMLVEHRWNEEREARRCELCRLAGARPASETTPLLLQPVYGDFIGGSLLQGSMKLAVVAGPTIYGLYSLSRLRAQPEVCDAGQLDPSIEFFMDAADVWYYGLKGDELYVYDAPNGELYARGPVGSALVTLLQEWEEARPT